VGGQSDTSAPVTEERRGFCRFCVALCGIRVVTEGDQVVSVKGDPDHPGSRGYTCAKGRALGRWHHHPDRILSPRRRDGDVRQQQSWSDAMADITGVLQRTIDVHGPDSVGVYIGTAASLDGAGKWAAERFVQAIGSRSKYSAISIDTPCKPLVSSLMSGYSGLVPVVDDQRCTLTVFVGCNPLVSHGHVNGFPDPVVRLRALAAAPREMWVIDSRLTESGRLATSTLMPRPGTDFAVIAFLIRELLVAGGGDREYLTRHADDVDVRTVAGLVDEWDVDQTSNVTGCPAADLEALLDAVRRHGRVSFQTGTGTTMSAAANVTEWLVWVLHVITGSYDREGGMWFHPGFLRQVHTDIEPTAAMPAPRPGPRSRPELSVWNDEFPCAALADEVEAGNLRALVVFGGNPMTAFPNTERTRRALASLDALIVLDVIDTETTALATHVLPTTGQLERADIPYYYDQFNLDCSTQFSPAFVPPMGESKGMWWFAACLAEQLGTPILPAPLSLESSDDDVLSMLASRAAAPFDEIRRLGYVADAPAFGWVRERVLPGGRWRLAPDVLVEQLQHWRQLVPPPGLLATSRRQLRQLNSQQPAMQAHPTDGPVALLHPDTAAGHGIADGDLIVVATAHGSMRITAVCTADVHPDGVSMPHGWVDTNVCDLTTEYGVDALTGMVVQTAIPVTIARPSELAS
jgi:anaerobic selenocysteine-containing dehydrogenase